MRIEFPNSPVITLDPTAIDAIAFIQDMPDGEMVFTEALDTALMVLNEHDEDFEECNNAIRDLLSLKRYLLRIAHAQDIPGFTLDLARTDFRDLDDFEPADIAEESEESDLSDLSDESDLSDKSDKSDLQ